MEKEKELLPCCNRCGSTLIQMGEPWRGCAGCVGMSDEAIALIFKYYPVRRARAEQAQTKKQDEAKGAQGLQDALIAFANTIKEEKTDDHSMRKKNHD